MLEWRRNQEGILECTAGQRRFVLVELMRGGCELMLVQPTQPTPTWQKLGRFRSLDDAKFMAAKLAEPSES